MKYVELEVYHGVVFSDCMSVHHVGLATFGTSCAASSAGVTISHALYKWWLEQPGWRSPRISVIQFIYSIRVSMSRYFFEGEFTSHSIPSLKFADFPIPKIWVNFGHCIDRPGDLWTSDLWLLCPWRRNMFSWVPYNSTLYFTNDDRQLWMPPRRSVDKVLKRCKWEH